MKKLYVGNLSFKATEEELQALFAEIGVQPDSLTLLRDRFTGQPRGFGFAEIRDDAQGALFRPTKTARAGGRDGFLARAMTRRAVQLLICRYVRKLGLDPNVTVHSFRVTALMTAPAEAPNSAE